MKAGMDKTYNVFRTMLFVPGHLERLLEKGISAGADCIVLDLEDAVPESYKEEARIKIKDALSSGAYSGKVVYVRVNPGYSGLQEDDIADTACKELTGYIFPHVDNAGEIRDYNLRLTSVEKKSGLPAGHFKVIPLIETASAVINALSIAKASDRITNLLFGCEDYIASSQGRHTADNVSMLYARTAMVLAARAAEIEPIDGPFVNLDDTAGLQRFAEQGRDLGMTGMLIISPRQIPLVQKIYTPSNEEITRAKEIIRLHEESIRLGFNISCGEKLFISPPTVRAARSLLKRYESIMEIEMYQS